MPIPTLLLECLGRSLLAEFAKRAAADVAVGVHFELAQAAWTQWSGQTTDGQRRAELEALAKAGREELAPAVRPLVTALTAGHPPEALKAVTDYLVQMPQSLRRRFRRPSDVAGTTIPFGLSLREALDLLALLPSQTAWFLPGDHTWDVGDYCLVELIETGDFGESWKATGPRQAAEPPVLLKFCLHPATAVGPFPALEAAAKHSDHPGLLQLRRFHARAHPLCLEYEFFESASLTSLIQEWQAAGTAPAPTTITRLLLDIALPLAHLHRLQPPLIHGRLRPEKILVRQAGDRYQCKVADLGVSDLVPRLNVDDLRRTLHLPVGTPATGPWSPVLGLVGTDPLLYLPPEYAEGQPPQPRDDIYALGVLWYQMLTANVATGRPGGLQWRKRLLERGLAQPLLELLEACFEDAPGDRPADAAELVEELERRLTAAEGTTAPTRRKAAVDPLTALAKAEAPAETAEPASREAATPRGRARRADVWQVFDTLEKKAPELAKTVTNSVSIKLVLIPAGTFAQGTPLEEEGCRENEVPRHEVTLTRPFYLAVTPITQQQYLRVMGQNPARFHPNNGGGPEYPVESVTWEQAVEFCRKLSEAPEEKEAKRIYRLPTEAEWEYACRSGTTTPFCYGTALAAAQANFDGNFPYGEADRGRFVQKTTRVGQHSPNNFGLFDMHGNVWEWCADWLQSDYYKQSPKRDPRGPATGRYRVLRGGSWRNHAVTCRAGYRNGLAPRLKDSATGFRVVLEVEG
jgi:formylglycine-generating enzyme required for sulfatase activity